MTIAHTTQIGASAPLGGHHFVLSPSDLTFLFDSCPRCFYLKVNQKYGPPRGAFPSIFTRIDSCMKDFYMGFRTEKIAAGLPPGSITYGDRWLESTPIVLPKTRSTVTIRGKMDTGALFDDGTYGIMDFKTVTPKPEHVEFYGRQLHAYAYCAEHPVPGKPGFGPVSRLGLIAFDPDRYKQREDMAYFGGGLRWVEIPRDDKQFMGFLSKVVAVLEQPDAPGGMPDCQHCTYRDTARRTGL